MSTEIRKRLESVSALLDNIREACRYEEEKVRLEELEQEMSTPGFHDDQENRDRVIGEYTRVRSTVNAIGDLEQQLEDTQELLLLGEEEKDTATIEESDGESRKLLRAAEKLGRKGASGASGKRLEKLEAKVRALQDRLDKLEGAAQVERAAKTAEAAEVAEAAEAAEVEG